MPIMQHQGLQQIFEENREPLLRYLRAHGAGDSAEDLLQELWLKITATASGPIASPRNYLFRAATNLMIDRRSEAQAQRRDIEWSGWSTGCPAPPPTILARTGISMEGASWHWSRRNWQGFLRAPSRIPPAPHRWPHPARNRGGDGLSASTIESDLRMVYRLLAELREKLDEE